MIPRYTRPEMGAIWSDEAKYERWLEVELAFCRAAHFERRISDDEMRQIESRAAIDVERIHAIEEQTHHDVIAFLESLEEKVGPAARHIHLGLTSTDVVDTALSLTILRALDILLADVGALSEALREKAIEYRDLLAVGRTHGMHAEATTFGMKFAVWWDDMRRAADRLERARDISRYGKLSGAVGTYAETTPERELRALQALGLHPAPIATQVLPRDGHAEILALLAVIAGTLEKISIEIRHLQRSEVGEAAEPFGREQKGSSAMPHKRNPVVCERITGLARVVRANAGVGFENQALWHERDISHSSAERIVLADTFSLVDYMLAKMTWVITGLTVSEERIARNLAQSRGLVYSSRILARAMEKGMNRKEAYAWVQKASMATLESGKDFERALEEGSAPLSEREIAELFDPKALFENVKLIYRRIGLEEA